MEDFYIELETFFTFVDKTEDKHKISQLVAETFDNFHNLADDTHNAKQGSDTMDQNKIEKNKSDSGQSWKTSLRQRVTKQEDRNSNVQNSSRMFTKQSQQRGDEKMGLTPDKWKCITSSLSNICFTIGDAVIENIAVVKSVGYWMLCFAVILIWLLFLPDVLERFLDFFEEYVNIGHAMEHLFRLQTWCRSAALFVAPMFTGLLQNSTFVECAVSNPLSSADKSEPKCNKCRMIRNLLSPKDDSEHQPFSAYLLGGNKPLLFKGWGSNTSLSKIQGEVLDHLNTFDNFYSRLESTIDYVKKIQDLASEETVTRLEEDKKAHVIWTADRYMTSRILAKLIPRPAMIPMELEIVVHKTLLIDGEHSPPFPLPQQSNNNMFYVQGSGSRSIVLTCEGCPDCSTLYTRLNPNDVLIYNTNLWTAVSQPMGKNTSVAVLASFRPSMDSRN